jgi:hypothetical protein
MNTPLHIGLGTLRSLFEPRGSSIWDTSFEHR